ncbi:receptor like protein kinase S.2-like [Rutidosis leptorrhynchoides]|uniref:receptor like protein kinase S.2-like n=1 Tax=Rutidosis leptorrhynchoides TaxID=125765 RepID=UPI003A990D7F
MNHLRQLCFILPPDHNDKPNQPEPNSHKHHSSCVCGGLHIHTPKILKQAIRRLYNTPPFALWKHRTPSGVFHDTEGVQFPNEKIFSGHSPKIFSYSELYIGTKAFSSNEILGSGGFGRVYRAVLPSDGTIVAVKCLIETGESFEKSFAAELAAVANLRHRNLVPLRGWCVHDDQLLLVYDYMSNRSLDRVLFRKKGMVLGWDMRVDIVMGLARALFYLHEQLEGQIIHRDVKTSNVMLDSKFNARLGDFGLARWVEHEIKSIMGPTITTKAKYGVDNSTMTRIGGTIGYLSPETFNKGSVVTAKSDVFSFGIVLLEIVTGRKAVDLTFPDEKIVLLDWIRELADEKILIKGADRRLKDGSYIVHDMERLIRIGLLSTVNDPRARPDMKWILGSLLGNTHEKLPDLPSFKMLPRYIAISPLVSSSTTTTPSSTTNDTSTTTESVGPTIFFTAKGESLYVTTGPEDDTISSMISSLISTTRLSRRQSKTFPIVQPPRVITYNEIIAATDDFSDENRLAELDFGTAYYGVIDNQDIVVKRLEMKTCPALRVRFSNELSNLGRLNHRNLVQLHGWCTEQGEMLVVYRYSANRVLSRLLNHHRKSDSVIQWVHRYNILKSLAGAVEYLHNEWEEQVIHRNITSSAIGIEPDMSPRLGSFALAEFLTRNEHDHHVDVSKKNSVRGIFGYMAPEYMESGEATAMADVYSFGVVVLEVVTGQMAVDFRRSDVLLVKRVHEFETMKRDYEELVDPRLDGAYDHKELVRLIKLAIACTRSDPGSRPSMCQVMSIIYGHDKLLTSIAQKKEKPEEWRERNALSLSLVRRIQALGIQ